MTLGEYKIRPGDLWDGLSLVVRRGSTDWNRAVFEALLRAFPNGPIVHTFDLTVTPGEDQSSVIFLMHGEDTRKLVLGSTYYGEIVLTVPSETPGANPDLGPYTLPTFTLESVAENQTAFVDGTTIQLREGAGEAFSITLSEGATNGSDGVDGTDGEDGEDGSGLGLESDLYIHPDSGNLYMFIDPLYYRGTPTLVDSVPTIAWDTEGIETPV